LGRCALFGDSPAPSIPSQYMCWIILVVTPGLMNSKVMSIPAIAPGMPTLMPTPRTIFQFVSLDPPIVLPTPSPDPLLSFPLPHSLLLPQVVCRLSLAATCGVQDQDLVAGSCETMLLLA
jgi:hypothetical protein